MESNQEQTTVKSTKGKNIFVVGAKIKGLEQGGTIDEYVREEELNDVINSYKHSIDCLFDGVQRFEAITKVQKLEYDKIGDAYLILEKVRLILQGLTDTGIVDSIDLEIQEYFENPTEEVNKQLESKYYKVINQLEIAEDLINELKEPLHVFVEAMRYVRERDDKKATLPS